VGLEASALAQLDNPSVVGGVDFSEVGPQQPRTVDVVTSQSKPQRAVAVSIFTTNVGVHDNHWRVGAEGGPGLEEEARLEEADET
jgi:hypothetical protein